MYSARGRSPSNTTTCMEASRKPGPVGQGLTRGREKEKSVLGQEGGWGTACAGDGNCAEGTVGRYTPILSLTLRKLRFADYSYL